MEQPAFSREPPGNPEKSQTLRSICSRCGGAHDEQRIPAMTRATLNPATAIRSPRRRAGDKDSGIFRPRAFAVLTLTTSSNLVGCSMGRSDGFAPCRRMVAVGTSEQLNGSGASRESPAGTAGRGRARSLWPPAPARRSARPAPPQRQSRPARPRRSHADVVTEPLSCAAQLGRI